MLDDAHRFTVTDLKQFSYCARVVYYERCLPHIRPRTYKMQAGKAAHEEEPKRAMRRSLSSYGELAGERFFDVSLSSARLNLSGTIDEVVRTANGELFPVDYKLARQVSSHYKLQLAAYALLLQDIENVTVQRGYIYLILNRRLVHVTMTPALFSAVEQALAALETIVAEERMPPAAENRSCCAACEFRRFCNDV